MAIQNPSFEEEGEMFGLASGWTFHSHTSKMRIAGFTPPAAEEGELPRFPFPVEHFESWVQWKQNLNEVEIAVALFDPRAEGFEDFEEGWNNTLFVEDFPGALLVRAVFAEQDMEHFEVGFSNEAFVSDWAEARATQGHFSPTRTERFQEDWRGPDDYQRSWDPNLQREARFDEGRNVTERFENNWELMTSL